MKVLLQKSTGFMQDELSAWARSFVATEHDVLFFDINEKPIFDAFYEINPDLFIVNRNDVDRKMFDISQKYNKCKILVIEDKEYKKEFIKNNNVHILSYLNKDIYPCFDPYVFKIANPKNIFLSEVNYISSEYNKEYLLFVNNFDMKIFGKGDWPTPKYVGDIKEQDKKYIVASCQYALCGSSYKDFKWFIECFSCNKICYSYKNEYIKNLNFNDFSFDDIKNFQPNPKNCLETRRQILHKYSSHNQVYNILNKIELESEAKKCLDVAQKLYLN